MILYPNKHIFLILLFCIFYKVPAQISQRCGYHLSGMVVDKHDKSPLAYATIRIKNTNLWAVSDSLGFYHIDDLCAGNYTVICRHIDCAEIEQAIALHRSTHLDFHPEHHSKLLNTILIYGDLEAERTAQILSQTQVSLQGDLIDSQRGSTLGESLQQLSGVNTLQTGVNIWKPVVHGLHSSRLVVINHGIRQEDQQWGVEHAPNIDPFTAGRISVLKGAAAVRYGSDAVGGVVLLATETLPETAPFTGDFYLLANSNAREGIASVRFEGAVPTVKALAWRLQATLKRAGDASAPHYQLTNTGALEDNFSATLAYRKEEYGFQAFYSRFTTTLGILRSAHIGNLTDLQNAIASRKPLFIKDFTYQINSPKQDLRHHLATFQAYYLLKGVGKLVFYYGWQSNRRLEFDIRRGGRSSIAAVDLDLQTHTVELIFTPVSPSAWEADAGITTFYQNNTANIDNTQAAVRRLIPDYVAYGIAGFLIARYKQPRWLLEAGLRYDYRFLQGFKWFKRSDWQSRYSESFAESFVMYNHNRTQVLANPSFAFNNIAATLGGVSHLNGRWSLKTNFSTAFRTPNVNELFSEGLHHGIAAIEYGDLLLKIEKSFKWLNTLRYQQKGLSVSLTAYYHYFDNYTTLDLNGTELTIRGAFPAYTYHQVAARIWGIDLNVERQLNSQFDYIGQFSFISLKDLDRDAPLLFTPAPNLKNSITYRLPKMSFLENFRISLTSEVFFKQSELPRVIDLEQLSTMTSEEISQERTQGAFDILAAPDTYHLLRAAIGAKISLKKTSYINLSFSIDNLLNTTYRSYLNRFRYYADELGRNFKLKLKYHF